MAGVSKDGLRAEVYAAHGSRRATILRLGALLTMRLCEARSQCNSI